MEFTFRPIERWPGSLAAKRRRAAFKAGYNATLSLLDTELRQLNARNIVLQVALTEDDIRLDGRPRAGSRVAHPGMILSFDSKFGPLSYPCDTFAEWQDNLRAIALGLEHLRAVDRYGVTKRGEQYKGWTALPPPTASVAMTRDEALAFLHHASEIAVFDDNDHARTAYRIAMGKLHPDRNGGDEAPFKRLQEAKDVLGL